MLFGDLGKPPILTTRAVVSAAVELIGGVDAVVWA